MVSYTLFVEGGGDSRVLNKTCREGFRIFLEKAGLVGNMPRILACGSRHKTYADFCTAIENNQKAFLLVDSEDLIDTRHQNKPWQYLATHPGDQWKKPQAATDEQCHFMVVCMESWLLADREKLVTFFGQGFQVSALPTPARSIESIPKQQVYDALAKATAQCKTKTPYDKGQHSFKLLALLNPDLVGNASPWARRFLDELRKLTNSSA